MDAAKMGRNRRRSSLLFPYEPDSERGEFIQFVQESGVSSVLIRALKALYDCPEKPDSPVEWIANYFRQFAPRRQKHIQQTKESLRKQLVDLESVILHMKDEQVKNEAILMQNREVLEDDVDGASVADDLDKEGVFGIDPRWLIAPDPFIKVTCSQEELSSFLKTKHDKQSSGSTADDIGRASIQQFLSRSLDLMGEDEVDVEEEEEEGEEWINNAYNIYKKTSKLPESESPLENKELKLEKSKEEEEEETQAQDMIQKKTENESEREDNKNVKNEPENGSELAPKKLEIHPDSLPPNYWPSGFNLEYEKCRDEIDQMDDESDSEPDLLQNGKGGTTNYYRPSKGCYRFVRRPERRNIIYENMWDIWKTDTPSGENDVFNSSSHNDKIDSKIGSTFDKPFVSDQYLDDEGEEEDED